MGLTVTVLLAELERRDVRLSVDPDFKLCTDAPWGAITPELAAAIREHKDLLVWSVIGRRTHQPTANRTAHHVWADCTTCGETCLVATGPADGPKCRMTWRCKGRHRPGHIHNKEAP